LWVRAMDLKAWRVVSVPSERMREQAGELRPARRLGLDSLVMIVAKGAVGLLNLGVLILIARRLGPSSQGVVSVGLALALILLQLGSLGLVTANPAWAARSSSVVSQIIVNSAWWAAGLGMVSAVIALGVWILAPSAVPGLTGGQALLVASSVPFALGSLLLQAVLLGERRVIAMNAADVSLSAITITLVWGVLHSAHANSSAALAAALSQYPLGVALYVALLWRHRPFPFWPDLGLAGHMLRFGLRVYLATVMAYFVVRADLLLVNAFLGSRQAGLYSTSVTVAQSLYLVPMAIGLNLFVRIIRGSRAELTGAVFGSLILPYGLLCLIVGLAANVLVPALFGHAYVESVFLLRWLLPGTFALGLLTILSYHFAGIGYPTASIVVWAFGLAANLGLNVILIPAYGTVMASITSSLCYGAILIGQIWVFTSTGGMLRYLRPRLPLTLANLRGIVGVPVRSKP
jgi:O-antigen/teichoic acid export membrane protein